jgi:hypothetical protein
VAKRVLDYDPISRITTYFEYHHPTDETIISREQDVSLILDANKALQNDESVWKRGVKDSWAPYASIPAIVLERWMTEHGVDAFKKENWAKGGRVWKLLNHPDYRWLKKTTKMHWG